MAQAQTFLLSPSLTYFWVQIPPIWLWPRKKFWNLKQFLLVNIFLSGARPWFRPILDSFPRANTCKKTASSHRWIPEPEADLSLRAHGFFLKLFWKSEGNISSLQVILLFRGNKNSEHLLFQRCLHRHLAMLQVHDVCQLFPNTISARSIFSLWGILYMADTLLTSGRFICSHWDLSKQNCCKGYLNPECQLGIKCSLLWLSFLVWNVQILKIRNESI